MITSFSPEGRIETGLRELSCAMHNFAKIAGVCGKTRLAEGLAGTNDFDNETAQRLLAVLAEMKQLQSEIDAPLDFSQVEKISAALVIRRVARIGKEMGDDTTKIAQDATNRLKAVNRSTIT